VEEVAEAFVGARGPPVDDVGAWMDRLRGAAADLDLGVQALDARAVCGRVHLESALLHARRAFDRGDQLSRTLEVEWVLCAAGVRQVDAAFGRAGVRPGCTAFALLVIAAGVDGPSPEAVAALLEGTGLARDDGMLECTGEALRMLGVGEAEMAAVPEARWTDLVLERTALLDLER
jgi:KEOPS complex subunit Cgi121